MNVYARWKNHKRTLNSNKHINKRFQSDWNKYGADIFKFEVIQECEPYMLNRTESRLIQKYDALNPQVGYNKSKLLIYDLTDDEIEEKKKVLIKAFNKNKFGKYNITLLSKATNWSVHDLQIIFSCITGDDLEPYDFDLKYNCDGAICNANEIVIEKVKYPVFRMLDL